MPEVEDVSVDQSLFVLPEPEWRLDKMAVSATHADFEMTCDSTSDANLVVEVKPVCMTFENYYCGFTADSHPAFKLVGTTAGTMERRNGDPTTVEIIWCARAHARSTHARSSEPTTAAPAATAPGRRRCPWPLLPLCTPLPPRGS